VDSGQVITKSEPRAIDRIQKAEFRIIYLVVLIILFCTKYSNTYSQDLHFSQYYRTPIFLNPANTGAMEEDIRLMAIARNQWATIPVNYNSIGMSADMNFPFKVTKDKFGLGIQVLADRAGDSKYTTFQATGSGAYHLVTSGLNFMILSIGANVNYINRSYNPELLRFPEQFNGDYFDPSLPVTEQFDRLSLGFFDFGVGPPELSANVYGTAYHFYRGIDATFTVL
jgi:type IX secretion system PorP/SprF family membrane protein